MPTYSIIGATGGTGSELVKLFLAQDVELRLYARSRERLCRMFPNLPQRVSLHVGDIQDADVMTDCIRGADTIFAVAATNHSSPWNRIAQDMADSITKAVDRLKEEKDFNPPVVVFLSTLSLNKDLKPDHPFFRWVLHQALFYIYEDVRLALEMLRKPALPLRLVEAQPSVIASSKGVGYKVMEGSRINELDMSKLMVTYEDLAGSLADIAGRKAGSYVVYSTRPEEVKPDWFKLFRQNLIPGLICSWARPLWYLGLWIGLWSA